MYQLLLNQVTNKAQQNKNLYDQFGDSLEAFFQTSHIEKVIMKISIIIILIIIAKTLIFYTLLNFKKWITPKNKRRKHLTTKENLYAPFKQPQSILGFCIKWNLYNMMGKLDHDNGNVNKPSKSNITVESVKRKFTYAMRNKLLKRDSVIALRVYLQEYIPKTNRKYENDAHYIHSVLKRNTIDERVLKCFDDLMDELATRPINVVDPELEKIINLLDRKEELSKVK